MHYCNQQFMQQVEGCLWVESRGIECLKGSPLQPLVVQQELTQVALLLGANAMKGGRVVLVQLQLQFGQLHGLGLDVVVNLALVLFSFVGRIALEGLAAGLLLDHIVGIGLIHCHGRLGLEAQS